MKPLSYRQIKRKLEKSGFSITHQRGSHVKFTRESGGEVRTVMVLHHREIRIGTLRAIVRHAGLTFLTHSWYDVQRHIVRNTHGPLGDPEGEPDWSLLKNRIRSYSDKKLGPIRIRN